MAKPKTNPLKETVIKICEDQDCRDADLGPGVDETYPGSSQPYDPMIIKPVQDAILQIGSQYFKVHIQDVKMSQSPHEYGVQVNLQGMAELATDKDLTGIALKKL